LLLLLLLKSKLLPPAMSQPLLLLLLRTLSACKERRERHLPRALGRWLMPLLPLLLFIAGWLGWCRLLLSASCCWHPWWVIQLLPLLP